MGHRTSKTKIAHSQSHHAIAGNHPKPYCAATGRRPSPCIEIEELGGSFVAFVKDKFSYLSPKFNKLTDSRDSTRCRYTPAELIWAALLMFLVRFGSRNQMDAQRNVGALPKAIASFAGRTLSDMPVDRQQLTSCSDNIMRFLTTLPTEELEEIELCIIKILIQSRLFDGSRVFDRYYCIIIDGSIREKCRKGFEHDGKTHAGCKYRYVLQASIVLFGHPIPLMQEHMDMVNPETEKEDCEINAARRLFPKLKTAFPRANLLIIGDALYACRPIAKECKDYSWCFCFTFKQGRTPAMWQEALTLMDVTTENVLEYDNKAESNADRRHGHIRWINDLEFSEDKSNSLCVTAMEQYETYQGTQTHYAWISNVPGINQKNVMLLINATGRERHQIEDQFNTQKNNGIGMEHVFCADATASKNLYSIMQIAFILWTLFYHGLLKRVCKWAKTWSQIAIAKCLSEALRHIGGAPPGIKIGQLRFVT